jgi:hypothetical protein
VVDVVSCPPGGKGTISQPFPILSYLLPFHFAREGHSEAVGDPNQEMAQLMMYTLAMEKHLIFSGKELHKRAWLRKGRPKKKDAAVIAKVPEDQLRDEEAEEILKRMIKVKEGFTGWMRHHITSQWLERAREMKMKNNGTGKPVTTYEELLEELESNPKMENFVSWYNISIKDMDAKHGGKLGAEKEVMKELKLKYTDNTVTGGCVGDLFLEVRGSIMEHLNGRSKAKQGLHVVKSKPKQDNCGPNKVRRNNGDFCVVKSTSKGTSSKSFNVSF